MENGIMTMCENIRLYLMVRMQQNRDNMNKYPLKICPKIMKLVEEAKDKSSDCTTYRSKDDVYEVEDRYVRKYKVDLSQYHYSCRRWDLTATALQLLGGKVAFLKNMLTTVTLWSPT
nr:uncharacterized protein LOC109151316 [Ipomoea trifida]